nr:hypothetical protein [Tanacetum cinerariifolium]
EEIGDDEEEEEDEFVRTPSYYSPTDDEDKTNVDNNVEDIPTIEADIISPMDVHVHHEVPSGQTPTLLTIPVLVTTESSPVDLPPKPHLQTRLLDAPHSSNHNPSSLIALQALITALGSCALHFNQSYALGLPTWTDKNVRACVTCSRKGIRTNGAIDFGFLKGYQINRIRFEMNSPSALIS